MHYGSFELVNYTAAERPLTDYDLLNYRDFVPSKGMTVSYIAQAAYHNVWAVYQSVFRLRNRSSMFVKVPTFDVLDKCSRNVQGIWLSDLFPGPLSLWCKNANKIVRNEHLARIFKSFISITNRADTAITVPPDITFDAALYALCNHHIWTEWGIPLAENYSTAQRMYVFSSSIPGERPSDKLRALAALPKTMCRQFTLVANDIPLRAAIAIGAKLRMRVTVDVSLIALTGNERLKVGGKLFTALVEGNRDHPGSSGYPPMLFCSGKLNTAQRTKLAQYYTKKADLVFY